MPMRPALLFLLGALAAALPRAAAAQELACTAAQQPRAVAELMFGRMIGDRIGVGAAPWARFLDREITPRFPDGLTVVDAAGQWRDPGRNTIIREPSRVVTIVLPGRPDDADRLAAIAAAYKARFRQLSVLTIVRAACVSF
jgi:hypothetical protein